MKLSGQYVQTHTFNENKKLNKRIVPNNARIGRHFSGNKYAYWDVYYDIRHSRVYSFKIAYLQHQRIHLSQPQRCHDQETLRATVVVLMMTLEGAVDHVTNTVLPGWNKNSHHKLAFSMNKVDFAM